MEDSTLGPRPETAAGKTWGNWPRLKKFINGQIWALVLIGVLIILMVIGTMAENYNGSEFAYRLIYGRWYFLGAFALLFVYLIFSFISNFPLQRSLSAIYVIKLGLILLGIGCGMTYWMGLTGRITLSPSMPKNDLMLPEDLVTINYAGQEKTDQTNSISFKLPSVALPTSLDYSFRDLVLTSFLPFSERVLSWNYPTGPNPGIFPSSQYHIQNAGSGPELDLNVVFTLHPEVQEFSSEMKLENISFHYLPEEVAPCFERLGVSKIILWDIQSKVCFTPEEQKIPILISAAGKRFLAVKRDHEFSSFFPDFSVYPFTQDLNLITNSPLRVMALQSLESGHHLFLMGPALGFFQGDHWVRESLEQGHPHRIDEMMLDLTLLHHTVEKIPMRLPKFSYRGHEQAVAVTFQGHSYWVTNQQPLQLEVNKLTATIQIAPKTLPLPFMMSFFQTDKGEYYIRFTQHGQSEDHRLLPHSPVKFQGIEFYLEKEKPSATELPLAASADPGRILKYLGIILTLVGVLLQMLIPGSPKTKEA